MRLARTRRSTLLPFHLGICWNLLSHIWKNLNDRIVYSQKKIYQPDKHDCMNFFNRGLSLVLLCQKLRPRHCFQTVGAKALLSYRRFKARELKPNKAPTPNKVKTTKKPVKKPMASNRNNDPFAIFLKVISILTCLLLSAK